MKKIIRVGLALTMVLVMLAISTETALAATNTSGSEVKGSITAIDKTATPNTVTITPEKGTAVVLKVDASTVITKTVVGNITINDLATNDKVTANYNKDTNIASKIAVIQPLGKRHSFEGTIKSMANPTLVVTTKKGDETFNISSETEYKVPGVKNATLANFKVGDKVSVSTVDITTAGTTVQIAQRLTLIPAKPIKTSNKGTVTTYTANTSITIQDKKGASTTFIINSDTKISLKKGVTGVAIGDQVTVTAQRDPSESQFTAKTISDSGAPKTKSTTKTEQGKKK